MVILLGAFIVVEKVRGVEEVFVFGKVDNFICFFCLNNGYRCFLGFGILEFVKRFCVRKFFLRVREGLGRIVILVVWIREFRFT